MALSVNVSVEAAQEYQVQEITYDGQEIYTQPLSMSENLTKLAHKIDFGKVDDDDSQDHLESTPNFCGEEQKELVTFQPSLWPWDSVRTKLRSALTEISVLVDVLNIAKEKRYMVLDPVSQDPPEVKNVAILVAKKKGLVSAAAIIQKGAERLRISQAEGKNRSLSDFHLELLNMRQKWRLRKQGSLILGDLSYRSVGSRFWQNGTYEVTKSEQPNTTVTSLSPGGPQVPRPSALKVTLPSELEGNSYIHVVIQKDTETIAAGDFTSPFISPIHSDSHWMNKLEGAQNVLFCKELFSQLAREAVQLQPSIPNLVVGNQITASLFPGVQLCFSLCHLTAQDKSKATILPAPLENKAVLEHSLYQLLREHHHQNIHLPTPHPVTGTLGVSKRRQIAGPEALDRHTLMESCKTNTWLEQIIEQTQHTILRLRTMYIIDTYASENKDPLIVAHWASLSSPTCSSVKINIMTHGYETIYRTPLVIHVERKTLKAVCRDGRVMNLSYEPQELTYLLMSQVSQHQVNAVQCLAKVMGWKVLSSSSHVGVGPVEPIGNASSVVMASSTGDRVIAIRCGPQTDIQVSVSSSPQEQDFYPSTLVRDRKWQNLSGSFREVALEKMEGKNFLNKMENLMACLTTC
ncbi:mediator of RNA polymerase II transcription subunit 17-like [Limulus polyphemus]|uniref:Mediator of RNA polymerase II transcription subunit 17 n=1 Tax=Limulus polyphemus TaxID=6850 RepID=A0ABM1BLQ8_LIMPO|nr:mediator of RNA polymerase II transcription subunit 17-like [Limulus polyphemus]